MSISRLYVLEENRFLKDLIVWRYGTSEPSQTTRRGGKVGVLPELEAVCEAIETAFTPSSDMSEQVTVHPELLRNLATCAKLWGDPEGVDPRERSYLLWRILGAFMHSLYQGIKDDRHISVRDGMTFYGAFCKRQ